MSDIRAKNKNKYNMNFPVKGMVDAHASYKHLSVEP